MNFDNRIPVRNGKGMSAPRDEGPRGRTGAASCGVVGRGRDCPATVHTPSDRKGRRWLLVDGI